MIRRDESPCYSSDIRRSALVLRERWKETERCCYFKRPHFAVSKSPLSSPERLQNTLKRYGKDWQQCSSARCAAAVRGPVTSLTVDFVVPNEDMCHLNSDTCAMLSHLHKMGKRREAQIASWLLLRCFGELSGLPPGRRSCMPGWKLHEHDDQSFPADAPPLLRVGRYAPLRGDVHLLATLLDMLLAARGILLLGKWRAARKTAYSPSRTVYLLQFDFWTLPYRSIQ